MRLSHYTVDADSAPPPNDGQVLFLLNFSTAQRTHLLTSTSSVALLYTPANEHFGIVPVEAMACGLPVVAANSGGPTESLVDLKLYADPLSPSRILLGNRDGTGLLRPPHPEQWSAAMSDILHLTEQDRRMIAENGKARVSEHFSAGTLGKQVEDACREAMALGDVHGQIGDKLIWGGAGLMLFAVSNMALMAIFSFIRGSS